jgi:hypothetical protein
MFGRQRLGHTWSFSWRDIFASSAGTYSERTRHGLAHPLVTNAATFGIASWIAVNWLGIGFFIDGLWPAFWGALLASGITLVLSFALVDRGDRRRLA